MSTTPSTGASAPDETAAAADAHAAEEARLAQGDGGDTPESGKPQPEAADLRIQMLEGRLAEVEASEKAARDRLAQFGEAVGDGPVKGPRALVGQVKQGKNWISVRRVMDTTETIDAFHKDAREHEMEYRVVPFEGGRLYGWPKGPVNIDAHVPGAIAAADAPESTPDDDKDVAGPIAGGAF